MELTSMLLQQLSGKTNVMQTSTSTSSVDFNQYINKATTKNQYDKVNQNSQFKKSDNKKDYTDKTKDVKDTKDTQDKKNVKTEDKKEVATDKKEVKTQEKQPEKVKTDNTEKEEIIVVDNEKINELAQVLGIEPDKLMDILSQLSMSISMLQNPENMVKFLQTAFDVESPAKLLAIDGMKEIMSSIKDIANSIDYKDVLSFDEFSQFLQDANSGNNLTIVNPQNEAMKEKIDALLSDLNGKVTSVSTNSEPIKVDYAKMTENNTTTTEELIQMSEDKIVEQLEDKGYYQNQENNQNNANSSNTLLTQNNEITEIELNTKQEVFSIADINTNSNTKVFNASLPKTQVLRNINSTDVINQIMENVKVSAKTGVSEVKIILKPEQLGDVSLKIATQNGIVTAQFIAENQKVKEIIESNFNQLRDMLSEQGVNVGALEVNVSSDSQNEESFNMFEQNSEKTNKRIEEILNKVSNDEEKSKKVELQNILDSQVNYSI